MRTYRSWTPEDTRTVRPGVLPAVPSVDRKNQGNIPEGTNSTFSSNCGSSSVSLTDGRRVGRGAAVVNARGCLVYMIYGTKIASVRCNFTHQLRFRLNQNRGSEKHDEREQKSAFQCSNTNKNRWMKAQAFQVQFQTCACKHGVSSVVTQRLRASLHL